MSSKTEPTKQTDISLTIQHDWQLCLKDTHSTFFIGVKNKNKFEYFNVQVTSMIDEFAFAVMPGEGEIKETEFTEIKLDQSKRLHVTFREKVTIFVAPKSEKEFTALKSAPRIIEIGPSGGNLVTADSSGNCIISRPNTRIFVRALKGHVMDVYRAKYFPSGQVLLTGGMDMTLKIWTYDEGDCARTLKGHTGSVTGIGIIRVGKEVLSCSNDGTARKWNCGSAETVKTWDFKSGKCKELAVSSDSSQFAVICEHNHLSLISLVSENHHQIPLPSEPSSVCFSGDESGKVVFVGFVNGSVMAFDTKTQELIGEIITDRGSVNNLKNYWNRLIVAFDDGTVHVYSMPPKPAPETTIQAEFVLSGAYCDPVYDMSTHKNVVSTVCRDGKMRLYNLIFDVDTASS